MHTTAREARDLLRQIRAMSDPVEGVHVGVCPPFPYLSLAFEMLNGSCIELGAQNCHWESQGAYTGEVSPEMLKDIGCHFVILGHSERRHLFGETDGTVRKKLEAVLKSDLRVIVCVGETLQQRDENQTETVVLSQVEAALKGLSESTMNSVTVAYEPVWAIGTGRTATPEQAQNVHRLIRGWIEEQWGKQLGARIRIQYGGSVKPANAAALLGAEDIDGALVGGASLNPEDFSAIVREAGQQ